MSYRRGLELPINLIIILVVAFFIFTLIIGFVPRLLGGSLGKFGQIASYTSASDVNNAKAVCMNWADSARINSGSPQQFLTSTYCTKRVGVPVPTGCWPSGVNAGSNGEWYHPCGGEGVSQSECGPTLMDWKPDYDAQSSASGTVGVYASDPGMVSTDRDYAKSKPFDRDLCLYIPNGVKFTAALSCWDPYIGVSLSGVVINVGTNSYECGVYTFGVEIFKSNNGEYPIITTRPDYISDTGYYSDTEINEPDVDLDGDGIKCSGDPDNSKWCDLNGNDKVNTTDTIPAQFTKVTMCACKDLTNSREGEYTDYYIYWNGKIWHCRVIEDYLAGSARGVGKCITA